MEPGAGPLGEPRCMGKRDGVVEDMCAQTFDWKRFWCPRSGTMRLGLDGYLVDPEDEHAHLYGSDVVPFNQIADKPCLVLLGEPGIGKTYAMQAEHATVERRLQGSNDTALPIDLKEYGNETRLVHDLFDCPCVSQWRSGRHTLHVFLDSLDECRLQISNLAPMLAGQFRKLKPHVERLRLRIACRTADWPQTLKEALGELWPGDAVGEYELAPLRRRDITVAAQASELDADAFLDEIGRMELQSFAMKPVTLWFLLKMYKRDRRLPETKAALYAQGCRLLCEETSQSRHEAGHPGRLSADKRLAVAERIAAVTMFCKKSAIYIGIDRGDTLADDVTIAAIGGGSEAVAGDKFTVDEQHFKEVLNTGLFSGRGGSRLGFAHRTYAEYLAAHYVTSRGLDFTQIMSLIRHSEDPEGRIVPQLGETAAWMGGMDSRVFDEILGSDPQVLLKSDVATASNADKAAVVDSLLKLFAAEKLTDSDWWQWDHYRKLRHPDLASQLEPYIRGRDRPLIARAVAIQISEKCKVNELQDVLVDVALDRSEQHEIRDKAAWTVADIGDDQAKPKLRPLAIGQGRDDPNDQLKGAALRALWPDHITAEELFANLQPPKAPNWNGSYWGFLNRELWKHLTVRDLPTALEWVQQHAEQHTGGSFGRLSEGILRLAWEHTDDENVLDPLGRAIIARIAHRRKPHPRPDAWGRVPWSLPSPEVCRRVVAAAVSQVSDPSGRDARLACDLRELLRPGDLAWVVEQVRQEPSRKRAAFWARVARSIFNFEAPGHVDTVFTAAAGNAVLDAAFADWLKPTVVEFDSPEAVQMKEAHEQFSRWQREAEERPRVEPPPSVRVAKCLEAFEAGDLDAWWCLIHEMTLEEDSTDYGEVLEGDLRALPGWQNADAATRDRIVQAAERYVLARDAAPDEWLGRNVLSHPAVAGYKALALLARESPGVLAELSQDVWRNWAPIIIGYPGTVSTDERESPHLRSVQLAYRAAPDVTISTLLALIDHENLSMGNLFVLRYLAHCWDERLCSALLEKVKEANLKPTALRTLLGALLEHGCSGAAEYAVGLIPIPLPSNSEGRAVAQAAAIALVTRGGETGWAVVWSAICHDPEFGKTLLTEVAALPEEQHVAKSAERLAEEQVADLYIWLSRQFPTADGTSASLGSWGGRGGSVGVFREAVLGNLRDRGTPAACRAIERIRRELPELTWLTRVGLVAKQLMLRETWVPPSPRQLLELTRLPGSRLVQSAGQLLDVVIESLRRLEGDLRGETPAIRDLWDRQGDKTWRPVDEGDLADWLKRHLERDVRPRAIVAEREVQIRRGIGGAKGQETDIHVTAPTQSTDLDTYDPVRVIIEVKGCWHPDVKTAMESQLVGRYLKDNQCQHGLYLVGWFTCSHWDRADGRAKQCPKWRSEQAQEYFDKQAAELSAGTTVVKAVVLNTGLPNDALRAG